MAKINKTKSWFLDKINKIDKQLARLNQEKKRKKIQINKTRNKKAEVTRDETNTKAYRRHYYKQLYANKMANLEEMDKFLEKYTFQNWTRKK